jgi:hypothetical protein
MPSEGQVCERWAEREGVVALAIATVDVTLVWYIVQESLLF